MLSNHYDAFTNRGELHMNKKTITLKPWQLIVMVALIVALIGGGIYVGMKWFGDKTPTADIDAGAQDWNNDLKNDDGQSTANKGEGIAIPGYPYISLPKDTANVQVERIKMVHLPFLT